MVYEKYRDALYNVIDTATKKLKEIGKIDFAYLYEEDEDGYGADDRPSIIIADRHCEIAWYKIKSTWYDETRGGIMIDCEDMDEVPICYAEGLSEISLYWAIIDYKENNN